VAREDDAPALTLGKPLLDQVPGAAIHRVLHLGSETASAERNRIAGNVLPVEPGGAVRGDLPLDVEIGADGERNTPLPTSIIESTQLDDRARRAVAGRVNIRQPDVVSASVRAVDNGICRAF